MFIHFRVLLTQESVSCHLAVLDVVKLVVKAAHEHLEFTSTQTDGKLFMPLWPSSKPFFLCHEREIYKFSFPLAQVDLCLPGVKVICFQFSSLMVIGGDHMFNLHLSFHLSVSQCKSSSCNNSKYICMYTPTFSIIKGTATLMLSIIYQKSSINHEFLFKYHQNRLKKGDVMGILRIHYGHHLAAFSFQNFFNCLNFSYQYYRIICVSADMQLCR